MFDVNHILDIFSQEAGEHLAALEKGFLDLESTESVEARGSIIDNLFRRAHGLKGAARAVELLDIQDCSQQLEDTLDQLRDDPAAVTSQAVEQGLAQFDELRKAYEEWRQPDEAAVDTAAADTVVADTAAPAPTEPSDDTFTIRVKSDRLDRMLSLAGELRISQRSADLHAQQLAALEEHLRESPVQDLSLPGEVQHHVSSGISNWRAELLAQLKRLQVDLRNKQVREKLLLEMLEGDIQQARLLPLSMLAESLRRTVRDLAQSLGKLIRYDIDVGDVMLDKAVIEALKDPLMHMIRNAADHGLETPEERQSSRKPQEGCIRLRADRRGDRVHIRISDDGRGIDFDRIRERVGRMGLLEAAEAEELDRLELAGYLFQAGFTTAVQANEISGRGVGLDAVADAVRRLHGSVELDSSSPAGSTFVISVPVTISTVRILTVTSGGQYYGIPSDSIVRTARVQPGELRELEGSLILTVDDEPVLWVALTDLVGTTTGVAADNGRTMPYVLISHEGKRLAFGVDDTEDELEVILKPLGFPLTGMPGIVGGTIRPDGSVQMVLDLTGAAFHPKRAKRRLDVAQRQSPARILVVDDSPTTRTIVRNLLAAAGYSVRTASDGVDALERLRSHAVDLVVSDVQMPRMNGLELTRQIKSQFRLPVVLVTGQEKEEHRREGLAAGADAYFVKSTFEGEGLLEVIKQFV